MEAVASSLITLVAAVIGLWSPYRGESPIGSERPLVRAGAYAFVGFGVAVTLFVPS